MVPKIHINSQFRFQMELQWNIWVHMSANYLIYLDLNIDQYANVCVDDM